MTESLAGNNTFLPRLLYLGDVPVEADMQGSALLYRLFASYPCEKLLIAEGLRISAAGRRIKQVEYRQYKPIWHRPLLTRVHHYTAPIATLCAPIGGNAVSRIVHDFRPQAVITVVGGYVWQTAAAYAERAGLPMHLIVHDDWPNVENHFAPEARWKDGHLRRWYPMAASRLCVSPAMAEEYCRRYGAAADVLYPSRAGDCPTFTEPAKTLNSHCAPFTVAFAGSIYPEYARALQRLAIVLQRLSGRVIVYGRGADKDNCPFLREPNIELRGMLSSLALIRECRHEAHAMFVPMSYRERDRINAELSFPSKLTDMTAIGLPLVIDGPPYCSAVRWASDNPGVAEIVTDEGVDALATAIARLQDPGYRLRLAREAMYQGQRYFAPSRAVSLLYERLRQGAAGQ
jgi:hypothetical protein